MLIFSGFRTQMPKWIAINFDHTVMGGAKSTGFHVIYCKSQQNNTRHGQNQWWRIIFGIRPYEHISNDS